jgi:hypothetical protein
MTFVSRAMAALFTLTVALPALGQGTVTRARDFGFAATWGSNEACPDPEEGRQVIGARLVFAESTGPSATPIAMLELEYANDCSPEPLPLPFFATGSTDPDQFSFPFNQQFTIDKRPGSRGLSFATYSASIPVVVEGTDCQAVALVDIRLDAVRPVRRERAVTRTDEDGTFVLQFSDRTSRAALPSGSIVLTDPGACVDPRVPTEFAVSPQVFDPQSGDPASFIFRARELLITRTR